MRRRCRRAQNVGDDTAARDLLLAYPASSLCSGPPWWCSRTAGTSPGTEQRRRANTSSDTVAIQTTPARFASRTAVLGTHGDAQTNGGITAKPRVPGPTPVVAKTAALTSVNSTTAHGTRVQTTRREIKRARGRRGYNPALGVPLTHPHTF